jgi:hypothetical protein
MDLMIETIDKKRDPEFTTCCNNCNYLYLILDLDKEKIFRDNADQTNDAVIINNNNNNNNISNVNLIN